MFLSLTASDRVLQRKKRYNGRALLSTVLSRGFMRTVLNILNFILGGFATTLGWLLATLVSIADLYPASHPLLLGDNKTLSFPYGNEAVHVDELDPQGKNSLLNAGGTLLNILWFIFFGWWLCLMHIFCGIAQCLTIIGIPVGIANFKIAAIALWPVGRRVVSVETARAAREANARRRFQ
jgi:uncharacterized membrane protein YccF (DUF307 family)